MTKWTRSSSATQSRGSGGKQQGGVAVDGFEALCHFAWLAILARLLFKGEKSFPRKVRQALIGASVRVAAGWVVWPFEVFVL